MASPQACEVHLADLHPFWVCGWAQGIAAHLLKSVCQRLCAAAGTEEGDQVAGYGYCDRGRQVL